VQIFDTLAQLGYGQLHFGCDPASGLRALIGVHSTRLGPGIGGCRIRVYPSEDEAVHDVSRLARAMTYKAALARLPHGGGKAVILAPPDIASFTPDRRTALFVAFGRFVESLGGRYVTTEDSGTSAADMDVIRSVTHHVLGTSVERGGSGDPSPYTALGVRRGIEAIAHAVLDRADLTGLHVAIQGVGHVGAHLARELAAAGARLTVAEIDERRRDAVARELDARVAGIDQILEVECDVLAPCALGGAITEDVVPRLNTRAIAGAANNQLQTAGVGRALRQRRIFYAPDYAINAGGLINVAEEYAGYDEPRARAKVMAIYQTILTIIERSEREACEPERVADRLAEEIIAAG
jgi:leucine dehydrogenase